MLQGYIRIPRQTKVPFPINQPCLVPVMLDLLLTAAENPYISTADGTAVPVGRGDVHTSICALSGRLNDRPLHIKRALLELADSELIELPNRLPANHVNMLITVLHFYHYSSYICDTPETTVRVYRSIMEKPWYADSRIKAVYLYLLTHTNFTRQIDGAKADCSIAELAQAANTRKFIARRALQALEGSGDIDYFSTDQRCTVIFRAPLDEQVIHVNFNKSGSDMK